MSSIWQNNKMLKRWEEKNLKKHVNGDFNYDLNTPQETPLIAQLSKELQINKDYIYIGAGSSQFITGIISLNLWENIILPKYEFSLYEKACKIYGKSIKYLDGVYINDIINNFKSIQNSSRDLFCISAPRWFSGEKITEDQIKKILKIFKGTILIDEAYVDYSCNEKGMLELWKSKNRFKFLKKLISHNTGRVCLTMKDNKKGKI